MIIVVMNMYTHAYICMYGSNPTKKILHAIQTFLFWPITTFNIKTIINIHHSMMTQKKI